MRQIGLKGKGEPKRFVVTTDSNHHNPVADNLLDRRFGVSHPNRFWVADITYIWSKAGWVYLAVVIDLFSRMVVGWAVSYRIDTALVCLALEKAVAKRNSKAGLLLHSDRGVQYTCDSYRRLAQSFGMVQSMSRKGNCWDNAVAESFFRTLKVERFNGYLFESIAEVNDVVGKFVDDYFNTRRFHSTLGHVSPADFESANQLVAQQ